MVCAVVARRGRAVVACDLRPPAARPRRGRRPDVRPAAADPAARLPDRRACRAPSGAAASSARSPAHLVRRGPGALDVGAHPVRPGRPRRLVPHLRGVPEPEVLRAVRQPPAVGHHARASSTARSSSATTPRPCCTTCFGDRAAPPTSSRSSTSPGSCFVPVSLVVALVWTRDSRAGAWYVTASPSTGCSASRRTSRCRRSDRSTPGRRTSARCRTPRDDAPGVDDHAERHDGAGQPVHAPTPCRPSPPSRPCTSGIMVTVVLMAELLQLQAFAADRPCGCSCLTVLATVYLGWHYFVDTIAGACSATPASDRRAGHREPMRKVPLEPQVVESADTSLLGVLLRLAVLVARPRPEEAAQAVPLRPWYDVQVQVRHRLAHGVVHRHEGSLRAQTLDHRRRQSLTGREERVAQLGGQVGQRHHVLRAAPAGHDP